MLTFVAFLGLVASHDEMLIEWCPGESRFLSVRSRSAMVRQRCQSELAADEGQRDNERKRLQV
jgi:hypothetical protein